MTCCVPLWGMCALKRLLFQRALTIFGFIYVLFSVAHICIELFQPSPKTLSVSMTLYETNSCISFCVFVQLIAYLHVLKALFQKTMARALNFVCWLHWCPRVIMVCSKCIRYHDIYIYSICSIHIWPVLDTLYVIVNIGKTCFFIYKHYSVMLY